jgi:ADP-heptose:LPS heptosyltransferase
MYQWSTWISGFLTPIIGVATAIIAYQQWKTNKRNEDTNVKRLKHELYDKRFAVYLAARTLLRNIMVQGEVTDAMLIEYWTGVNAARFLLDKNITTYLEEIEHTAVDLQTKLTEARESGNLATDARERGELKKWFYAQIAVLNEKFYPYLGLEN